MAQRERNYIPYPERLASALACLLPQLQRDDLRRRQVSAEEVIRLFTYDHLHLHSLGGSDAWHNIDPRLRGPELKEKDKRDTKIAAKAKRIDRKFPEFGNYLMSKPKPLPKKKKWASRPFPSRRKK